MSEIYKACDKFVKEICAGRKPSHGYEHMKKVAESAMIICCMEASDIEDFHQVLKLCCVVSWLHDVADHKYEDVDGLLRLVLIDFLGCLVDKNPSLISTLFILKIIDRISFSKENESMKNELPLDWDTVLGPMGVTVRKIVSDADKLEAINLDRYIEYIKETCVDISKEELIIKVKKHAEDKLLRLKDEFIRTKPGKMFAESLHDKLVYRFEQTFKINTKGVQCYSFSK